MLLHKNKSWDKSLNASSETSREQSWVLRLGNLPALFFRVNDQAQLQSLCDPEIFQMPTVSHILLSNPLPAAQV